MDALKSTDAQINRRHLLGLAGVAVAGSALSAMIFQSFREEFLSLGSIWPQDMQVLFFGERHGNFHDNSFLLDTSNEWKPLGVTHLALEVPCDYQTVVDRYSSGEISRHELVRNLSHCFGGFPETLQAEIELIDRANQLGLKIICADAEFDYVKTYGFPFSRGLTERNRRWATNISGVIEQNPSARIICFGGEGHFGYQPSNSIHYVNEFLLRTGVSSFVIRCSTSEKTGYLTDEYRNCDLVLRIPGAGKHE